MSRPSSPRFFPSSSSHMTLSTANATPTSTPLRRPRSLNPTRDLTTSPSSTTISESAVSTSFRQTEGLPVRARTFQADHKMSIRSDPALLTCFDPADKQLYDLWVPKA